MTVVLCRLLFCGCILVVFFFFSSLYLHIVGLHVQASPAPCGPVPMGLLLDCLFLRTETGLYRGLFASPKPFSVPHLVN